MAKHTLELDDLELTALITHLEGQSEMMCESRANSSNPCLLYTSPSPRDPKTSRMPSSA